MEFHSAAVVSHNNKSIYQNRCLEIDRAYAFHPCLAFKASGLSKPGDVPSSLSGGFGVKLPILVPFKSTRNSVRVLDAKVGLCVNRWPIFETYRLSPFGH
jgi:hypothetical protein